MADIKLKDKTGRDVIYYDVDTVSFPDATGSGIVTFGDISSKPQLYSPSVFAPYYKAYYVDIVASNGDFPQWLVCSYNDSTVSQNIHNIVMANSNNNRNVVPWIYNITPQTGGYCTIGSSLAADGFNPSSNRNTQFYIPTATETPGYCSVSGLGWSEHITSVQFTYDSNFPRTFQEVTDIYGNKFIRIPTMYRKVISVDNSKQINTFAIATSALDEDYVPYPCFIDRTNSNAILPYILIGQYCMSSTTVANSVDATPVTNFSLAQGRTLATERGTGYQLYDWQIHQLFKDLGLVISHFVKIVPSYYVILPRIMGIDHQNYSVLVDGFLNIYENDKYNYFCSYDPANYYSPTTLSEEDATSHGYVKVNYDYINIKTSSYDGNGIDKVGYDADNPFCNFPFHTGGTNYENDTYYCSQITSFNQGAMNIHIGYGGYYFGTGWWSFGVEGISNEWFSCRLCYRPILNATGYTE